MRNYLTLGPVRLLVNRQYLASWGYPRLSIGGLSLWSKSNNGDRTLASYHPRDSLTWHWSVSITKRNPAMWSAEAREGRAQLYREGNPFITAPSWRDRFMILTNNPRGQWHNYFRLPFGRALCIARQDYHLQRQLEEFSEA